MYNPGSHILTELSVSNTLLLSDYDGFKQLLDEVIQSLELTKVGEVYHNFNQAGFTAVVCLTESHISIHTWPEFNLLTFDVFLSNFMRDNTVKTHAIADSIIHYFKGEIIQTREVKR